MTSQTKQGHSFVKQAGILAMAGIICRIIGLLYRSPLTGIIGETGNGFYAPAYRIYQMILLISSYSIPSAVSKVISQRLAVHQYKNAQRIFRCSVIYVVIVGGVASLFAFLFADLLSPGRAALVLRMLAPTIFFSGLLGVLRGYFQATKTMVPTSLSQILEQILNAVVSIGAAFLLMQIFSNTDEKTRAAWGAVGSALGTGIGVLVALAFMFMLYRINKPTIQKRIERDTTEKLLSDKQIFKIILSMVTPVILSTFAYNASALINQTLYLQVMEKHHGERLDDILIINGIYDTQAVGLSNIPIAIASAMASALLPSIAGSFEKREMKEVNHKIHTAIKTIMFIAIPAAVGMMVLARPIVWMLYPTTAKTSIDMGGALLAALGCSIVFYSLSTLSNAILQAVGKATKPVTNACIALAVQTVIAALLLFITDWGIYCLPIAVSVYSLMMCVLNGRTVKKATGYRQEWIETFLLPFWAAVIMGIVVAGVYYGMMYVLASGYMSNAISIAVSVVLGMLAYFVMALKFGAMKKKDLQAMPGGRTIVRFAVKLHLMKD